MQTKSLKLTTFIKAHFYENELIIESGTKLMGVEDRRKYIFEGVEKVEYIERKVKWPQSIFIILLGILMGGGIIALIGEERKMVIRYTNGDIKAITLDEVPARRAMRLYLRFKKRARKINNN